MTKYLFDGPQFTENAHGNLELADPHTNNPHLPQGTDADGRLVHREELAIDHPFGAPRSERDIALSAVRNMAIAPKYSHVEVSSGLPSHIVIPRR